MSVENYEELFKIVPTAYKVILKLFGTFQVIYFLCKLFEYFEHGMAPQEGPGVGSLGSQIPVLVKMNSKSQILKMESQSRSRESLNLLPTPGKGRLTLNRSLTAWRFWCKFLTKLKKMLPDRESNPGRLGENQES